MSFDQIEAELRCPSCGAVNPAGPETGLQVWWTSSPENRALRVGDEVDTKDPELAGYLKLNDPAPGGPVRIVDTWECTVCGRGTCGR
jgi:rubredoxin